MLACVVTLFTDWWPLARRVALTVVFFFASVSVCDFGSTQSFRAH